MSAYATSCVEPAPGLTPARAHTPDKRSGLWSRYRLAGFLLGSGLLHVTLLLISGTLTLPTLVPHPGGPPRIAAQLDTDAPAHPPVPRPADHGHSAHVRPTLALHHDAARQHSARAQRRAAPVEHLARTPASPMLDDHTPTQPRAETHTARPAPAQATKGATKSARAPRDITRTGRASAPAALPAVRGAAVRAVIERALQAHFYYPYVARRNGWQGEIDLGLRIDADGRISDVHVVKSSGYGVLDRAALASARSIKVLPKLVDLLYGHTVNLVLPVRYRLYEG